MLVKKNKTLLLSSHHVCVDSLAALPAKLTHLWCQDLRGGKFVNETVGDWISCAD